MSSLDLQQGSEAWRAARAGSLGASCVHDVIARTKSGYSASRANRLAALVCERLTGVPEETYVTAAMRHGIELEPEARAAYAFFADADVSTAGLFKHPRIAGTHASPDGLVGEKGLLELKCPQPAAHLALLESKAIPANYLTQTLWQMACCEREWVDFVSYCPRFPADMQLFIRRVHWDDKLIRELEMEVEAFLREVDAKVEALTRRYAEAA